ncbi:MAG: HAMP domain-containing sensor histidine kinase [Luteolibacter sp.]
MRRWPLKIKVGVYAALLTMATLLLGVAAFASIVYYRQLHDLDDELQDNADELVRDLHNFRGAPVNPRHQLSSKFVPVDLQDHFLMLMGPEGQVLYHSPNLKGESIEGAPGFHSVKVAGQRCRTGSFKLGDFTVHVGMSLAPIDALYADLRFGMLMTMPLIGVMVFAGGLWLGKQAVEPMAALSAAAEEVSLDDGSARLPTPPAEDEIARLTVVLNSTFDRMRASYASTARFSADASHQLKTPVAVLRAGLEYLRDSQELESEARGEMEGMLRQVRRLSCLIQDLLLLSRTDARRLNQENRPFDLADLLDSGLDDLETLAEDRLRIEHQIQRPLEVCADPAHVAMVVQNLIENAAKYTPMGGTVRVTASRVGEIIRLSVANTGAALPAADREGIFERFRRGSLVGESTSGQGLGLNIARELARAHGGELALERSDGEWTEFVFTLPANPSAV